LFHFLLFSSPIRRDFKREIETPSVWSRSIVSCARSTIKIYTGIANGKPIPYGVLRITELLERMTMIEKGATYVVMGLLDADSIAFAIGQFITAQGGKVIYTVQSERMKRIFFDRSDKMSDREKAAIDIRFCDITVDSEIAEFFHTTGEIAGVVHSIAFANPKTCLGEEFHTSAIEDLKLSYHISCLSLASVVRHAYPRMSKGGSVVALTFESQVAFPYYNWMGVNKAALEGVVRALARRHGRDLIRVNAVSSGPVMTKAAKSIPHFAFIARTWRKMSPLPWDVHGEKESVAYMVAFLLGPFSQKITGQVLHVDGGASITGGELMPFERHASTAHDEDEEKPFIPNHVI
jgi:enoyl-[acyl-carrier protein] reductase I